VEVKVKISRRARYNECVETRRMCPNCRAFITTGDKVCPYCEIKLGAPAAARRAPADLLGGLIPHARFTTIVILLINAGFYLAQDLPGWIQTGAAGLPIFQAGAKIGPLIQQGQWWRLLTAGFLHGNFLHILMNSWVLFDLGAATEEAYGTSRYLVFYFVSTITGFYASYLLHPFGNSVGSSAGIFGLLGAMIALGVRDKSSYGAALRAHYVQWGIYAILLSALFPQTDNAAHIGGVAGGFAIAYIAGTPRLTGYGERLWQFAGAAAVGLTAVAFAFMFRWMMAAGNL
jgi:rhomboid protease GluP